MKTENWIKYIQRAMKTNLLDEEKFEKQTGVIPYLKCEYELQIKQLQELGINTEVQLFEQSINSLIHVHSAIVNKLPDEAEKKLLQLFGFSKDGAILAGQQLKVFEFIEWLQNFLPELPKEKEE